MTRKTNKPTKIELETVAVQPQIRQDTMLAILIVSLTVNLFVLIAWVTLQVTSAYDAQVATFLFTR